MNTMRFNIADRCSPLDKVLRVETDKEKIPFPTSHTAGHFLKGTRFRERERDSVMSRLRDKTIANGCESMSREKARK